MTRDNEAPETEIAAESLDGGKGKGSVKTWLLELPPEIWIFAFYLACALFLTWPLIAHMNSSVYGHPADNLGSIWVNWWYKNHGAFGGSTFSTTMLGFPFKSSLGFPFEPLGYLYWRFLMLFTNEVIAWNVDTILGFFLSGVTMYYLVRYILADRRVAFFAGFAYLFAVYHAAYAAYIGAALGATQWMPLFVLCLLKFLDRPRWKTAVYLALSAVLVASISLHYGLFMAVFTGAFLVARWIYNAIRRSREEGIKSSIAKGLQVNRKTALMSLTVILILVVAIMPFFYIFVAMYNPSSNWPTSPLPSELRIPELRENSGALPVQYIAPNTNNPVLGNVGAKMLKGTLYSFGNTSYVGWSILALAIACPFVWMKRRKGRKKGGEKEESEPVPEDATGGKTDAAPDKPHASSRERQEEAPGSDALPVRCGVKTRATLWGFATAAVVAFLFSLRPVYHIGKLTIPMPSALLGTVAPWFRWYNRFAVVVALCLIVIASFTIYRLLLLRKRMLAFLIPIALIIFLAVEMVLVPPFRKFDFATVPPVFKRVSELGKDAAVAYYPMEESGPFVTSLLMFYQRYTRKPMINGAVANSDGEAMRRTVYDPYDPAVPGILSRLGIENMVLFEGQIGESGEFRLDPGKLPAGLEQVERFRDKQVYGNARLYRVTSPPAELVPLYLGNISVPYLLKDRTIIRLLDETGTLKILNYSKKDQRITFRIPVTNRFPKQQVEVALPDGKPLFRTVMGKDQAGIIELRNLLVPANGLDLEISARGSFHPLTKYEVVVYGVQQATLELGNVEMVQSP